MKIINDIEEYNKEIQENEFCIVKIGTSHCGPCKIVQQNIKDIEKNNSDVCFIEVDAEECEEIIDKYNIRGIPVILFIKNGEVCERKQGILTQADLENMIKINI